jgi:hypothetical protein
MRGGVVFHEEVGTAHPTELAADRVGDEGMRIKRWLSRRWPHCSGSWGTHGVCNEDVGGY